MEAVAQSFQWHLDIINDDRMTSTLEFVPLISKKKKWIEYLHVCSEFHCIQADNHSDRSSFHIQEHRHHRSYKERFHMETRNKVNIPWIIQFVFKEIRRVLSTKYMNRSYQRTAVTEGNICMNLFSLSVLVCGQ